MRIDPYISALLFEHDCVIIPGFGGFVGTYSPARFHPSKHQFDPPHKQLAFNKHLKNNDGLLANHISVLENKTFSEANSILHSFVFESTKVLKDGGKLILDQIGTLYMDMERTIQFEPDNSVNYLRGAFGMTSIQTLPIKRDGIQERIEKEFKDRPALPQEKKKNILFRKTPAIISVMLILFASAIVFFSINIPFLKEINYSSLNPFSGRAVSFKTVVPSPVPVKTSIPRPAKVVTENTQTQTAAKDTLPHTLPADKTSVTMNTSKTQKGSRFHIVSGCFKIKSNAQNFLARLKSKNLNASIIGQNKEGLYIVSCGDFSAKEEAYSEMARIRSEKTEVWMLEK